MKTRSLRRNSGFTLVELLVVIAIIAVLAGAGFAAGTAAIQKAKKTTALATATSLEMAVTGFYTEYGTMPAELAADTPVGGESTTTGTGLDIVKVLLGSTDTASVAVNPRSIKFLSVKEAKAKKGGVVYTTSGVATGLFDPWGGPFKIVLDGDYDDVVKATPKNGTMVTLNGRKVAVWSEGADYKDTSPKTSDDVKTW